MDRMKSSLVLIIVMAVCIWLTAVSVGSAHESSSPGPVVTDRMIHVYGKAAVDGGNVLVGSCIRAYTPGGVICGQCEVTARGYFGLMNIFGDDPQTEAADGAGPGESLCFTIDGISAQILSDRSARWSEDGTTINIDLLVGAPDTSAPTMLSATVKNPIHIEVLFNEAMDDTTGHNTANYLLQDENGNGVKIYRATVQPDPSAVLLNTDVLHDAMTYILTLQRELTDLWGNNLASTVVIKVMR